MTEYRRSLQFRGLAHVFRLEELLASQPHLAARVARTLAEFGGHLECRACGRTNDLISRETPGGIEECLKEGWPKCCGQTMTWLTADELARRAPACTAPICRCSRCGREFTHVVGFTPSPECCFLCATPEDRRAARIEAAAKARS